MAADAGVGDGMAVGELVVGGSVVGADEAVWLLGTLAIEDDDGDGAVEQADTTTVPRMMAVTRRIGADSLRGPCDARRAVCVSLAAQDASSGRSTIVAIPWPTPMHMVASP